MGPNVKISRGFSLGSHSIYGFLQGYRSAAPFSMSGEAFNNLAWGIAEGVADWIDNPINVALIGLSEGAAGFGIIENHSTRLYLAPVIPLVSGGLTTAGFEGPLKSSLSIVVTLAIAHAVTQFGGYTGVCPTVSVGTDASKVVMANPGPLVVGLNASLARHQMTGPAANQMAMGLGLGIAALVLTAFGTGKVTGVAGPLPSTGPSFSKVG